MFKREFTYTDYNGVEKKKTRWFSLEKDEMLRLQLGNYGGLEYTINQMMKEQRPDKVLDLLEDIVLSAVGEVSPDGDCFYKTDKIREEFRQSKICHDLLFELMGDEDAFKTFMMGAIPAELASAMAKDEKAAAAVEALPGVPGEKE